MTRWRWGGRGLRSTGMVALYDTTGLLRDINSIDKYSILDTLNLFFGEIENDENIFSSDVMTHKYYDINSFNTHNNSNLLYMLSVNVCSLMSKHDSLSNFITNLTNKNVLTIAVQEVWEIPNIDLICIPGYNFVHKSRLLNRGGGVAFYIRNDIQFKIIDNLSHVHEKVFECLTLELNLNGKKIIASNIYKSPNPPEGTQLEHNDMFINYLDTHLYNLSVYNCDSYVFTDSNINLFNLNNNNSTALYLETIYSNGFNQKIGHATRIAGNSFSLIDHILTKSSIKCISSGTILTDFSDHFTNFITIDVTINRKSPQFCYSRNFSPAKIRNFKLTLETLRWRNILTINDPNEAFEEFWTTFHTLFELHFPLKKSKFNRNIHKANNFMTIGLLTSRKNKNILQKKP